MKNSMLKKGLLMGMIILFFGAGVFPSGRENVIIKENTQIITNTQTTYDNETESSLSSDEVFMVGGISNLTYNESECYYEYEYKNLRTAYFFLD